MQPTVKIGKYTGAGAPQSLAIGFIPDTLIIQQVTDYDRVFLANPNLTNFSNGTATLITSSVSQVSGGSYVTVMGPMNVGSTKQHGFVVGNKLAVNGKKYIYTAMRSAAGEQGGL